MDKRIFLSLTVLFLTVFAFSSVPQSGVEIIKIDRFNNLIEANFNLPDFKLEKVNTKGGMFTKIVSKELGYSVNYGQAQLPTATFSLMLTSNTLLKLEVVSFETEKIKLDAPVFPVQKPWPKSRRIEDRPFTIDRGYYRLENPEFKLLTMSSPYIVHGAKGVSITIHPFRYFPKKNVVLVYRKIKLRIKNVSVSVNTQSPVYNKMFSDIFINYFKKDKKLNEKSASMGRILIITPSRFTEALGNFVSHKRDMGYIVDLYTLDDTGTTKEEIRDFIKQRYALVDTRPDFLILVGDTGDIPAFRCSTADNPYTDLYYGAVDGEDYFPDISVGRFSVQSEEQLENIINKTVFVDTDIASIPKSGVFITADDNYQITEATHNYVIENYFEPNFYECQKIYMHTTGASKSQIAESVNSGQRFVVYSGHGDVDRWHLDWSVLFTSNDVATMLNNTIYPFVYSFACLTGKYDYSECFAEKWLRVPYGAATMWASSVYSYWDEDDVLERNVFKSMFKDRVYQIGPMFNSGKIYLYNYYHGGGSTERYFQQYNLFGDPSVFAKVYKPVSQGELFVNKEAVGCGDSIEVELWDSDLTSDTVVLSMRDLSDTSNVVQITLNRVEAGKYSGVIIPSEFFGEKNGVFEIEYNDENYGGETDVSVKREIFLDCDSPMPVYFNADSRDATSGKVDIKFNEKCSSISLKVYSYPDYTLVNEINLNNAYELNETVSGLQQGTQYVADIFAVDTLGNEYSQTGTLLFETPESNSIAFDSCDSEDDFIHGADQGVDVWSIVSTNKAISNGLCWFGQEKGNTNSSFLVYGPVTLDDKNCVFSFYHSYYMEDGYDGGLVEISTDGGNTYFDLGSYMIENGYNSVLDGGLYSGRMAFTGGKFGELKKTIINLSAFKGETVYIRFICSSDVSLALDGGGWYIDNISFEGVDFPSVEEYLVGVKRDSVISMLPYEDAEVTIDVYNASGQLIASKNIVLEKDTPLHTKLTALFDNTSFNDELYTVILNGDKKVGTFFMDDFTDSRGEMRNWTEACYSSNKITVPVPHIAPEIDYWNTFIQIANIGDSEGQSGMAYAPLDTFIPFDTSFCNPYSSKDYDVINTIFNNSMPEYNVNTANVFIKGDNGFIPLCATESFEVKDKDNSCKLTLEQNLSNTLYVAHVDNSDYWWTGVALINPNRDFTATVELIPYNKEGEEIDNGMVRFFLNPGEKYAFVTKDVLPYDTAWFRIDSTQPLIGYELFGTMNRKLLTGLDLISKPSPLILLPVVDSVNDWFGLTIVNPYSIDNDVNIKCYFQGSMVFAKQLTLSSYSKWVGLLSDLYQGDVDMIKVESNSGVISFCLEGNGHDDSTMTKLGGVKGFEVY